LAYKYEIERNLRTPDYAGFMLLGLTDYSGQGTAVVGPLNVFGREKGYVNASQWRRFCSEVVPLACFPKMVFTDRDTLTVPVKLYNASGETLRQAQVTYDIFLADSTKIADGKLSHGDLPQGKDMKIGVVRQKLDVVGVPAKCRLAVHVSTDDGRKWSNDWDFWVYPSEPETLALPDNKSYATALLITDTLDARALSVLSHGGRVLLQAAGKVRYGNNIKQTYLPVFWNTSWFKMRPPHTTGAVIDNRHPLFRNFPTDDWANLNWWELLNHAQVILLDQLPSSYLSPIQPIDTWHISRKLGMLVEAKVLNGRLLMTSMDISTDLSHRHVARQMRYALLKYMLGPDFNPSLRLTPKEISNFFDCDSPEVNMFTRQSPDELKPKIK
ncbi:MAG: beta-glucuronidase, partial [Prevotella sp.]